MFTIAPYNKAMFVLLTLMHCTCTPEYGPVPFYPITEDAKHYVVFPKGSYWIYEEVNNGNIDSVYLYRSEVSRENGARDFGFDFELFTAGYGSSYTGDSTRGTGHPFHNDQNIWSYSEGSRSDPSGESALIFLSPLNVSESRRYAEDFTLIFESQQESMKMDGVTYDSVKVFRHNIMVFANQSERIFFAKDVGIIKRELFNGQTWVLKKHFINH